MFCPNCGFPYGPDDRFCGRCGAALPGREESPSVPPPQQPSPPPARPKRRLPRFVIPAVLVLAAAAGVLTFFLTRSSRPDPSFVPDSQTSFFFLARDNPAQAELAKVTNRARCQGTLKDAMRGADLFIGVSAPGVVDEEMVHSMAKDPIVFPMANPVPEIMPELAVKAGAKVVGTGRSDFPNQINNVLAFPGIFRGALDVRASSINEEMKAAASHAIASLVSDDELRADYILPQAFDKRIGPAVAAAVARAARETGAARK